MKYFTYERTYNFTYEKNQYNTFVSESWELNKSVLIKIEFITVLWLMLHPLKMGKIRVNLNIQ